MSQREEFLRNSGHWFSCKAPYSDSDKSINVHTINEDLPSPVNFSEKMTNVNYTRASSSGVLGRQNWDKSSGYKNVIIKKLCTSSIECYLSYIIYIRS